MKCRYLLRKYNIDVPESIEFEDEILELIPGLSDISENVVSHIAGFVVRKLKKMMDDTYFKLLNRKNRGGLLSPSSSVINICILVEKKYRFVINLNDGKIPKEKHFFKVFIMELTRQITEQKTYFLEDDEDHVFEHELLENPQLSETAN